ncbi:ataxin-10-like [Glandiceps talaboti]
MAKLIAMWPFDQDTKKSQYNQYLVLLKNLTTQLKKNISREAIKEETMEHVKKILIECCTKLSMSSNSDSTNDSDAISETELCCECFRVLRNSCVQCKQNQDLISTVNILPVVKQLLDLYTSQGEQSEGEAVAVRCAIQFIGNYVAGNQSTQMTAWQTLFPKTLLGILRFGDLKASQYICMVIYNCLNDVTSQQLIKHPDGQAIMEYIVQSSQTESQPEWGLMIMEVLLQSNEFILTQFERFSLSSQTILLDVITAKLDNPATNEETSSTRESEESEQCDDIDQTKTVKIPAFTIAFLAEIFETQANGIFQSTVSEEVGKESAMVNSMVVTQLLQVVCVATSIPGQYKILQERTSLLQIALELLQKAHLAGKSGDNVFSIRQTLSGQEGDADNPAYGFKRDLIRLIGNMTYRNQKNQDLVRESEGIPLLLDHCNVDEYNPFMNQWAIFAIHNICEDNPANQAFIANMQRQGIADSEVLTDMGVDVQERDGKLYVKTTKKTKS